MPALWGGGDRRVLEHRTTRGEGFPARAKHSAPERTSEPRPLARQLLHLQRTAGNRAVSRLITRVDRKAAPTDTAPTHGAGSLVGTPPTPSSPASLPPGKIPKVPPTNVAEAQPASPSAGPMADSLPHAVADIQLPTRDRVIVQRVGFWDIAMPHLTLARYLTKKTIGVLFDKMVDRSIGSSTAVLTPNAGWDRDIDCYAMHNPADGTKIKAGRARMPRYHEGGLILDIQTNAAAMTLDTHIFVSPGKWIESTYVHELVHVGQYGALGKVDFLLRYFGTTGVELVRRLIAGEDLDPMTASALENDAYAVEERFEAWLNSGGCPPPPPPPVVLPHQVLFDTDKHNVKPAAATILTPLLPFLRNSPHPRIVGHTDSTAPRTNGARYNQRLSERRAAAVVQWFVTADPSLSGKLTPSGLGATMPIAPNTTAAGRAQNRRVEVLY